jgi:hypothetical protein
MMEKNNLALEYGQITLRPLEKGLLPVQLWALQNWCKKNSVKLLDVRMQYQNFHKYTNFVRMKKIL